MSLHKISYKPLQKVENIDLGMRTIINKHRFPYLYLLKRHKSFPIINIQEINEHNYIMINKIVELLDQVKRRILLSLIQKKKVFLLFGYEFVRVFNSYPTNRIKKIRKEVVCLYIPGLSFCPGMYEMTTNYELIN